MSAIRRAGHGCLECADIREGRREDDGGRRWDVTIRSLEEQKRRDAICEAKSAEERGQLEHEDLSRRIVELLKLAGRALSKSKIADGVHVRQPRIESNLAELLEEGLIAERQYRGHNGQMYDGFCYLEEDERPGDE